MFLKFASDKLGEVFFTRRFRFFFLGISAGSSVEICASASFFCFFPTFFFFFAPVDALPFVFFQDALALFRDSLKLVEPLA